MPVPESDYLDDDFGRVDPEPEPAEQLNGAEAEDDLDLDDDDDQEEEFAMSTQGLPEDRTHVNGGERPDDDKAAESAPIDKDLKGKARQEALLDEGVEETFPASDPVSVKHIT